MTADQIVCPHCQTAIHPMWSEEAIGRDRDWDKFDIEWAMCPACNRWVVKFGLWKSMGGPVTRVHEVVGWPANPPPRVVPEEIPDPYRSEFLEACLVLPISAKASAALTRRLLQRVLHEKAGIKGRVLNAEIDAVIEQREIPSHLAEDLDELRHLGNFGAHPIKVQHGGEVVDVEPGEAEAGLDVLFDLLDYYFVRQAVRDRRREALAGKLRSAGSPR
jgi:hypothetical protein